jgi:hypothetical protein
VECDEVRKALNYLGPEANKKQRQTVLGLVMGRVVAHELYHILARTTAHAAEGLARAISSFEDLVTPGVLTFSESDSRAIREHTPAEHNLSNAFVSGQGH